MSNFEPCMESVSFMIEEFKKNAMVIALQAEIEDVKGTLKNEQIWRDGSSSQEQIDMHEQNIADLEAYLEWLEDEKIKAKEMIG